jgi:hypothetical protein
MVPGAGIESIWLVPARQARTAEQWFMLLNDIIKESLARSGFQEFFSLSGGDSVLNYFEIQQDERFIGFCGFFIT